MSSQLRELLQRPELTDSFLNETQICGFVTAMAAAPHILDPSEWLAYLWGGEETAPFTTAEELESFANIVIDIWNQTRADLLAGTWQWPEGCALDDKDVVTEQTRTFTEGMLQGWQLSRDDWETLMPENTQEHALLGGVLLCISLLFDPESALDVLSLEGADGLAQFEEIYTSLPTMLCGLTLRAQAMLAEQA